MKQGDFYMSNNEFEEEQEVVYEDRFAQLVVGTEEKQEEWPSREHTEAPQHRRVHAAAHLSPTTTAATTDDDGTPLSASMKPVCFQHNDARGPRLTALILGFGALASIAVGTFFFAKSRDDVSLRKQSSSDGSASSINSFSASEVAEHNVPEDCWLAIHGNVYDLTDYAPEHPGGPEYITDFCGMDATKDYDIEHPLVLLDLIPETVMGTFDTSKVEKVVEPTANPSTAWENGSSDDSPMSAESSDASPTRSPTISPTSAPAAFPTSPRPTTARPTPSPTVRSTPQPTRDCYAAGQVAQHNTRGDCWYILYGQVYDFTDYVQIHPGGERRIFEHCGTDATIPYMAEKKHDERLLEKKASQYWLGLTC